MPRPPLRGYNPVKIENSGNTPVVKSEDELSATSEDLLLLKPEDVGLPIPRIAISLFSFGVI